MTILFESDLLADRHGANLQKIATLIPTTFIELEQAVTVIRNHGYAKSEHDAQQCVERMCQWGLCEWSHGPTLQVRRCEVTVRSESDRRKLAQRVWHTDLRGQERPFNFSVEDDPIYKPPRSFKKPRWTAEQKRERAKAEADAKRSTPMKLLRKVVGK